jgi:hypothetical protein
MAVTMLGSYSEERFVLIAKILFFDDENILLNIDYR